MFHTFSILSLRVEINTWFGDALSRHPPAKKRPIFDHLYDYKFIDTVFVHLDINGPFIRPELKPAVQIRPYMYTHFT